MDVTGPHPTPQLGTVGRKQEAHSHRDTAIRRVSAWPSREGVAREDNCPSHRCEGEEAGSHTLPRTGVELLKKRPFSRESRAHQSHWLPLSTRLS